MKEGAQLCLDTLQRKEEGGQNLGVFACQSGGSASQVLSLTPQGQLRRELVCADASRPYAAVKDALSTTVALSHCDLETVAANHKWRHDRDKKQLVHEPTGWCLDAEALKNGDDVRIRACVDGKASQAWEFEHYL